MTAPLALIGLPLLAAALILALPALARGVQIAAAVLMLLAAIAHAAAAPAAMLPFILLLPVLALALAPIAPQGRLRGALAQAALAAAMLALLAEHALLLWAGTTAAALLLAALLAQGAQQGAQQASWTMLVLAGTGALLALFGLVALHVAMPEAGLRLDALAAGAAQADAGMLQLAMLFALLGFAAFAALPPLHAWAPEAGRAMSPAEALLPLVLLPMLGLLALLRLPSASGLSGIVLPALGVAGLLLGAFALWRRRDAREMLAFIAVLHAGMVAIALGLGGPAGRMAALLQLLGHALAMTAALLALDTAQRLKGSTRIAAIGGLAALHPPLGWGLALALLALAGLPPFLPFAAEFLLLTSAARQAPWLLAPLLLGLVVGATAIAHAAQTLCLGAPTPDVPDAVRPGLATLLPLHGLLALLLLGGIAMPAALTAWLRAAAGWPS